MLMLWMIAASVTVIVVMIRMLATVTVVIMIVVMAMVMVVVSVDGRVIMTMMRVYGAALGFCIGAAFGVERRLERNHSRAKAHDHRLDHGIAADAQSLRHDFGRQMAVAEVPGDAGHRQRVCGPYFRQRFGLGDHFHHAPVLEPQTVSAAKHRCLLEVEQEFEPADPVHDDAPAITCVEVEHDRVRWSARPMSGRNDFVSAQHHCLPGLGGHHWETGSPKPSLNEKRSKRQSACKPGSVWPGLIAPT